MHKVIWIMPGLFVLFVIFAITSLLISNSPEGGTTKELKRHAACVEAGGTIVPNGACVQKIHLEGFDR